MERMNREPREERIAKVLAADSTMAQLRSGVLASLARTHPTLTIDELLIEAEKVVAWILKAGE